MPKGRVAIVTGAASGIGEATARRFAEAGLRVVLVDRDAAVAPLAAALGGEAHRVDLAEEAAILDFAATLRRQGREVDILVNNAGIHRKQDGRRAAIEQISTEAWNEHLAVNLTAPFLLCRELLPLMRGRGWGRIVNVASRAGRTLSPMAAAHYSASKAGLIGFTRVLANEVAPDGITANSVAPGPIATALAAAWTPEQREGFGRGIPLGRYGSAAEVAAVIAFLASEEASYVTGACYDVNGGTFLP
ncbi:SDR family oxidoreductase [Roseomonas sp. OT10]|uniref:SDR family NAD(P)-dependent oxidoreductase n=1 Tax=Roseomonas cutis TaxID=2897332 RepID=UPI001E357CDD|nr:SDR family NAD(P)-dependent oxidoreductase [Roseomonas sp. OT10]UFN48504.1 SDR family oxidoreductase [Roseomonas sp. OT10]